MNNYSAAPRACLSRQMLGVAIDERAMSPSDAQRGMVEADHRFQSEAAHLRGRVPRSLRSRL